MPRSTLERVKVSYLFKILLILFCLSFALSHHLVNRDKRTFFSLMNRLHRFSNCGLRSCPPWKCQDDSAVIHGYCCQCAGSEYDKVPVPCYPDLKCPHASEPLCSDYNFMMNCCCTGP